MSKWSKRLGLFHWINIFVLSVWTLRLNKRGSFKHGETQRGKEKHIWMFTCLLLWALLFSTHLKSSPLKEILYFSGDNITLNNRRKRKKSYTRIEIPAWKWARWSCVDHGVPWCNIRFCASLIKEVGSRVVFFIQMLLWWGDGNLFII